jgi:protein-tyrosine phosphatase
VSAVANGRDGAVLIHCAGGVDRTGIVSALILRVAGVGIDTVAADWAESEQNWAPAVQPWIDGAPTDEERTKRKLLSVMPPGAMRDVLVELEAQHGSARRYLAEAGVLDSQLDELHDRLRV